MILLISTTLHLFYFILFLCSLDWPRLFLLLFHCLPSFLFVLFLHVTACLFFFPWQQNLSLSLLVLLTIAAIVAGQASCTSNTAFLTALHFTTLGKPHTVVTFPLQQLGSSASPLGSLSPARQFSFLCHVPPSLLQQPPHSRPFSRPSLMVATLPISSSSFSAPCMSHASPIVSSKLCPPSSRCASRFSSPHRKLLPYSSRRHFCLAAAWQLLPSRAPAAVACDNVV